MVWQTLPGRYVYVSRWSRTLRTAYTGTRSMEDKCQPAELSQIITKTTIGLLRPMTSAEWEPRSHLPAPSLR